ncbi:MAG: cob(I)yrinic acid a,c-diamide adenosyltransferase [Thaumarchaeota archaeon]|nr:cob(I)yrinic acid a,c-diamide adenosyltransferase [Nitrososphaerota archaeon]
MKIYTKTGDDGTTGLIGGMRVKKSNLRIGAYGSVDEINSSIGMVLSGTLDSDVRDILTKIQNDLFIVGSDLANPDMEITTNRVTAKMVEFLETQIDRLESELDPITYFILPGGSLVAAQLHISRTVCRRAEINVVMVSESETVNKECKAYLNRLSDLLFVLARAVNKRGKINDVAWKK